MLIDSHCHLNLLDLTQFDNNLDNVMQLVRANDVQQLLSVCVELEDFPILKTIADRYSNVYISVGIHPNHEVKQESDALELSALALSHPACIAIGETGLDYYRELDTGSRANQQQRFREHIRAAIQTSKPLIIHTRHAAEDTLKIMAEENAHDIGGVMHCFAEDWHTAEQAMAMNFYISLSGILTFKNATVLQEIAKKVPLEKLLIETDSPYLAPVPFRGKQNHPALVKHVAEALAELKGLSYETIAKATSENFKRCFRINHLN